MVLDLVLGLLGFLVYSLQELGRHWLRTTHFLFSWLAGARWVTVLVSLVHLVLLVLLRLHAELVGDSVVDLARWQLHLVGLLLS